MLTDVLLAVKPINMAIPCRITLHLRPTGHLVPSEQGEEMRLIWLKPRLRLSPFAAFALLTSSRLSVEPWLRPYKTPSFRICSFRFMDFTSSLSEPWPPGHISLHSLFLSLRLMNYIFHLCPSLGFSHTSLHPRSFRHPPPVHSRLTGLAGYAPFPFRFFSSSHSKAIVSLLCIHYCWRVVQIFSSENHTRKLSSRE